MKRTVVDLPEAKVVFIRNAMDADRATVEVVRQPNGKFTVIGTYPDRGAKEVVAPADFAISDRTAAYIVGKETFVAFRYQDVSDHATIGYGHHKGLSAAEIDAGFPDGLTEDQAWALMLADADEFAAVVRSKINVPLPQHRVDALIQVAFATGNVNSEKDAVNAGDHARAAEIIRTKHNTTGGQFHAGLAERFGQIADLYLDGVYPVPTRTRAQLKELGLTEIRNRYPDKLNRLGNSFGRPTAESQKRQAREAFFRMTGQQLP